MKQTRHIPVLLNEVLEALHPRPGQTFVDCTVGLAGHSKAILSRISPGGRLIGLDMDPANLLHASSVLSGLGDHTLHNTNFAGLPTILAEVGIERVDGILADLGVASPQIDDSSRGFSYRADGPLDMRMNPNRGKPASDLIATITQRDLARNLRELGDEEDAEAVAQLIVERREEEPITTTMQLASIVCEARGFTLRRALGAKLHPAARTFQTIRMLVNRELANLERLLAVLPDHLNPGGRAAIISFHSGEDRMVKHAFRHGLDEGSYAKISNDPVTATEEETRSNSRSRSAKLRWAERG